MRWGGLAWIDPAHNRDRWRPLLISEMNLWVPENLLATQERLCFMKIVGWLII